MVWGGGQGLATSDNLAESDVLEAIDRVILVFFTVELSIQVKPKKKAQSFVTSV